MSGCALPPYWHWPGFIPALTVWLAAFQLLVAPATPDPSGADKAKAPDPSAADKAKAPDLSAAVKAIVHRVLFSNELGGQAKNLADLLNSESAADRVAACRVASQRTRCRPPDGERGRRHSSLGCRIPSPSVLEPAEVRCQAAAALCAREVPMDGGADALGRVRQSAAPRRSAAGVHRRPPPARSRRGAKKHSWLGYRTPTPRCESARPRGWGSFWGRRRQSWQSHKF